MTSATFDLLGALPSGTSNISASAGHGQAGLGDLDPLGRDLVSHRLLGVGVGVDVGVGGDGRDHGQCQPSTS